MIVVVEQNSMHITVQYKCMITHHILFLRLIQDFNVHYKKFIQITSIVLPLSQKTCLFRI